MVEAQQPTNYCIALQPICDRNMRHVADELLYRASVVDHSAQVEDQMMATARVSNAAFYETGLDKLVGKRPLFFIAPHEWLQKPELLPPYPEQVVVEVLGNVLQQPGMLERLKGVKAAGFRLALDAFDINEQSRELLKLVDVIKMDALSELDEARIKLFRDQGIALLARRVEDMDAYRRCQALGFEYFQGYFYARPEVQQHTSTQRGSNRGAQIRILSELQKAEPDYKVLEPLIAQDPQLTLMLLKLTNSPMFRRRTEVTSISQALSTLGLDRVRSMVTTVMLANNGAASRLLLPQALTRAAMCERMAASMSGVNPREAFMAGLMSMMDLLMGLELEALLKELPLAQELKAALLFGDGKLGRVLKLVKAFEQARMLDSSHEMVQRLNGIWMDSQVWTNQVLMGVD
ncbi:EAL and HDOD domain-containing protein [Marinospirillum alkaliphilum]|uniref:EAL and modified HD-GYP domain-containing signal transduction protein n=1 Tax=Marinospirillum alkaliphilum DSM 21637 TaxID=1122209 RepID=A0A1K1X207_9GAMM|nr:HDOD domain-containing protein [Marinospirillum alkaliphilum]SFX43654.1 EAL and modified HD-GYP domain-containing signal transduction protein [Marinospirillum alkaliphilum DSM 21637]